MRIILKSTSPRRKELLTNLGYDFEIKSYDVDETIDKSISAYENVKNLGLKKALAGECGDFISIGCDTIVVLDDVIYGKPKDKDDCIRMLKELSGRCHYVMSGLGVVYKDKIYNIVDVSKVYFKKLDDELIDWYINTKEYIGKAGGYAIQGYGSNLVEKYEGSFNNIVGLPTEELSKILGEIYEMEN